jgi:hypothetical protein
MQPINCISISLQRYYDWRQTGRKAGADIPPIETKLIQTLWLTLKTPVAVLKENNS